MSEPTYYILHLTREGQERLSIPEDFICVWDYSTDTEATISSGRRWCKARAYNPNQPNREEYLIPYDHIKKIESVYVSESNSEEYEDSDCFIATASSANSYELDILYKFRDNYLVSFSLGRKFIDFYYSFSPQLANIIKSRDILKHITLWLFIKPIVFTLNLFF